jgi:hypothetical protein
MWVYQPGCYVDYYPDGSVWQEDARGDGETVSGYGVGVDMRKVNVIVETDEVICIQSCFQ